MSRPNLISPDPFSAGVGSGLGLGMTRETKTKPQEAAIIMSVTPHQIHGVLYKVAIPYWYDGGADKLIGLTLVLLYMLTQHTLAPSGS